MCEAECQVKLHLLVREKGSDGTQQAAEILQGLKDASPEPVLGLLSKVCCWVFAATADALSEGLRACKCAAAPVNPC